MIKFKTHHSKAVAELILAGAFWGASFTFMTWALRDFTTSNLLLLRFVLAFILGESLLFIFSNKTFQNSFSDAKKALPAGIFMGLALVLQTHGLHYTTATNSSFITSLYVVLIPFINFIFFKFPLKPIHILIGSIAFIGMGLLLNLSSQDLNSINSNPNSNLGIILTFSCAIASSFHILLVGKASNNIKSGFRFNNYQMFWSLIPVVPFYFYETLVKKQDFFPGHISALSLVSLLGLIFLVSILAFYLQIRAQKNLSTSTASMLCLLEAPYAYLFAVVLLNESLKPIQYVGMLIILGSSAFSVYIDRPKN